MKKNIIIIIGKNLHVLWGSLPFDFIGACEPHTVYPSLAFTIGLKLNILVVLFMTEGVPLTGPGPESWTYATGL